MHKGFALVFWLDSYLTQNQLYSIEKKNYSVKKTKEKSFIQIQQNIQKYFKALTQRMSTLSKKINKVLLYVKT
jgi:hypothetical protein